MKELIEFVLLLLSVPMVREEITVTWYNGPGPNTSCGDIFDPGVVAVAAPLDSELRCHDLVIVCVESCIVAIVWDRIPKRSSDLYGGNVLDLTPAAMTQLNIPHGYTAEGLPYGRSEAVVIYP